MKKAILTFISVFLLMGCNQKKQNNEMVELTNEEKIILMINQCIDDYNNDLINEREAEWNTTIKPLPIMVDKIENITSLNQLEKIESNTLITSAEYIGAIKQNDYKIIFEIYNYGNNFWLNGNSRFEIDINAVEVNKKDYADIKKELDYLLVSNNKILSYLYGAGISLGKENPELPGFFEVLKSQDYDFNSIDELKVKAETIFTKDFLQSYYDVAFNNEDPIYKEIYGKLYCSEADITLSEGLPYDTSRIIAIKEENDNLLVDILISFNEDVSNEVYRIVLIKTENGYRLNNTY